MIQRDVSGCWKVILPANTCLKGSITKLEAVIRFSLRDGVMLKEDAVGYAGDVDPKDAYAALAADASAVLVDVRTVAEWTFVGLTALQSVAKEPILLEWQRFPSMSRDPEFETKLTKLLTARGAGPSTPIYFLCRSGGRSRDAAIALTDVGFTSCYNVASGFEGPPDQNGHRGRTSGWKASGLPWSQS